MFYIFALYLDFEGAKDILVLKVLILGFRGHWRVLTKVWYINLGLNMDIGLWYTHVPNFGILS